MEQLLAAHSEEGLEHGERTVKGEEDCVWVSAPETAGTEDENRVPEEEKFMGLTGSGGMDQEEEEEEMMDEEHQILCEGSQRNRALLCVCAGLMPHNDATTCLNTGLNAALGVWIPCLTVHVSR